MTPDRPLRRSIEVLEQELRIHQVELEIQNEELRAALAELERSRDRYVDLYDFAPSGYVTLHPDGVITEINLTGAALLGEERRHLMGRRFASFIESGEQDHWHRHVQRVLKQAQAGRIEMGMRTAAGTSFRGLVDCLPVPVEGSIPLLRVTVTNVTEKWIAQERLRQRNEQFGALSRHVPGVLFQLRLDGSGVASFPFISEAASSTLGVPARIVLEDADRVLDCIPPGDKAVICESLRASAASMQNLLVETRYLHPQGGERWLEAIANPARAPDGTLVWHGYCEDVTHRRRIDQERVSLESQLRESQKLEALGTLAGGIAQEFDDQLALILGHVRAALRDARVLDETRERLDTISAASQEARHTVQQLLNFSARGPASRKRLSVETVVAETRRLVKASLPPGIEMACSLAADLPDIEADPRQVRQVLLNLCLNAGQAIGADGHATMRLSLQAAPLKLPNPELATPQELVPGNYVRLTVQDTGPGVDAATAARVLEPCVETRRVVQAAGLGLSVVHGIMRAHGGAMAVRGAPGRSTTFEAYFPASARH